MKIEAVTVCVGYADFLAETVVWNAVNLDRWVIVTTPDDKETIELCRKRNLQCVTTREFFRDDLAPGFNKGRGLSLGMNFLSSDAWMLVLDADIVLPRNYRNMVRLADLDPACLYGADRICLQSWQQWQEMKASGYLDDQHGWHLCCNPYLPRPVGTRIIRGRYGYVPIGFHQLFHAQNGIHSGFRYRDYPDSNSDAAHSDIKFALQFDRRNRQLLPEVMVVHLESEPLGMGANWKGRTTKRFGPDPAPGGASKPG